MSTVIDINNNYFYNSKPDSGEVELKKLNSLVDKALTSLANQDLAAAAAYASGARALAKKLADNPSTAPQIAGIAGAVAQIMELVNAINNNMTVLANLASLFAQKAQSYTDLESQTLTQDLTGDAWVPDWHADKSSDHKVGPDNHNYCPGLNNIPPNDEYAGYWQTMANQKYQLDQQVFQGKITAAQTLAQNGSDAVSACSKTTQGNYANLQALIGIFHNLAGALR